MAVRAAKTAESNAQTNHVAVFSTDEVSKPLFGGAVARMPLLSLVRQPAHPIGEGSNRQLGNGIDHKNA
jgi:hypothetical protein